MISLSRIGSFRLDFAEIASMIESLNDIEYEDDDMLTPQRVKNKSELMINSLEDFLDNLNGKMTNEITRKESVTFSVQKVIDILKGILECDDEDKDYTFEDVITKAKSVQAGIYQVKTDLEEILDLLNQLCLDEEEEEVRGGGHKVESNTDYKLTEYVGADGKSFERFNDELNVKDSDTSVVTTVVADSKNKIFDVEDSKSYGVDFNPILAMLKSLDDNEYAMDGFDITQSYIVNKSESMIASLEIMLTDLYNAEQRGLEPGITNNTNEGVLVAVSVLSDSKHVEDISDDNGGDGGGGGGGRRKQSSTSDMIFDLERIVGYLHELIESENSGDGDEEGGSSGTLTRSQSSFMQATKEVQSVIRRYFSSDNLSNSELSFYPTMNAEAKGQRRSFVTTEMTTKSSVSSFQEINDSTSKGFR